MKKGEVITFALCNDFEMSREGYKLIINGERDFAVLFDAKSELEMVNWLAVAECRPDVCIILYRSPRMQKLEHISEIKRKWPEIKIIAMMNFRIAFYTAKLYSNGVDACGYYDLNEKEIINLLSELCDTGIYFENESDRSLFQQIREHSYKYEKLTAIEQLILTNPLVPFMQLAEDMKIPSHHLRYHWKKLIKKLGFTSDKVYVLSCFQYYIEATLYPGSLPILYG